MGIESLIRRLRSSLFLAAMILLNPLFGCSPETLRPNETSQNSIGASKFSSIPVPATLQTTNDRPKDLFSLNNRVCYTALTSVRGRKLVCIDPTDSPRLAFDLNPGGSDNIGSMFISGTRLYFVQSSESSCTLHTFDGTSVREITLPNQLKCSGGADFFHGEGELIYFRAWLPSGARYFSYDGTSTSELILDPNVVGDLSNLSPWGVYAERFYFTAQTGENQHGLFSYKSTENNGDPRLVLETRGFAAIALAPRQQTFQSSSVHRSSGSPIFIAHDQSDQAVLYSLSNQSPAIPQPISGAYGTLTSANLIQSSSLGTCFSEQTSGMPARVFCIEPGSLTATEKFSGESAANPLICPSIIDGPGGSYLSSMYQNQGCSIGSSPIFIWTSGGTSLEAPINSSTFRLDGRLVAPMGNKWLISGIDTSDRGKTLCPHGGRALFSYDPSGGAPTSITDPKPCSEGSAISWDPSFTQVAVTSTGIYFIEEATKGRSNFGMIDQSLVIRKWDGQTTKTIPSANSDSYLNLGQTGFAQTHGKTYITAVDTEGLKLYQVDTSGFRRISQLNPGGADPIVSYCSTEDRVLFSTYRQSEPGSGSGAVSELWAYHEPSDSLAMIHSISNTWGHGFSFPSEKDGKCLIFGSKVILQVFNVSSGTWVPHFFDGAQLQACPLPSGDAVTSSLTPMTDLLSGGFFSKSQDHLYFPWPDSNGKQKLHRVNSEGVTEKVIDLNAGTDDEIETVISLGDTLYVSARDRSLDANNKYYRSVFSVTPGETKRLNLSVVVYTGSDEQNPEKTGNYIQIMDGGGHVYAIENVNISGSSQMNVHALMGDQFQATGLVGVFNTSYLGSVGSSTIFSLNPTTGAPLALYSINATTSSPVDLSALGSISSSDSMSLHGSSTNRSLLVLFRGVDSIPNLFHLSH